MHQHLGIALAKREPMPNIDLSFYEKDCNSEHRNKLIEAIFTNSKVVFSVSQGRVIEKLLKLSQVPYSAGVLANGDLVIELHNK